MRRWGWSIVAVCSACGAFTGAAEDGPTADAGAADATTEASVLDRDAASDTAPDDDGKALADAANEKDDAPFVPTAVNCMSSANCDAGDVCCLDVPAKIVECRGPNSCGATTQWFVCLSPADCGGKTCGPSQWGRLVCFK